MREWTIHTIESNVLDFTHCFYNGQHSLKTAAFQSYFFLCFSKDLSLDIFTILVNRANVYLVRREAKGNMLRVEFHIQLFEIAKSAIKKLCEINNNVKVHRNRCSFLPVANAFFNAKIECHLTKWNDRFCCQIILFWSTLRFVISDLYSRFEFYVKLWLSLEHKMENFSDRRSEIDDGYI